MDPVPSSFPRQRDWWWLALGLGVLFTWYLGSRGLNEPDEGRYANIALTMAKPGADWWEPRMSGFGHYDKPPLIYWTTALSFRVFGCNEWAARFPSLVGAVMALAGLAWAGGRLRGARTAWWAVLICGTTTQFWALGRVLSPDMLLTGWCTLAVAAWAEARHRGGAWGFWALSLWCWSMAWWTKATPALIPLAGLAAGTGMTRDRAGWQALRLWLLLPLIVMLGSPWYFSMLHRYPELKPFFFSRELAGRLAGHVEGRRGFKFYYLPVSLLGWLPWWPLAAWVIWRERIRYYFKRRLVDSLWIWSQRLGVEGWIVIVGLVILSLASSKLSTYSLPVAPWVALGFARLVPRLRGTRAGDPGWPVVVAPAFGLLALVAVSLLPPRYESRLRVNSSLRDVCRILRARGAVRVETDHYWGGMEFYLGESPVRYVVHIADPSDADPRNPKARSTKHEHYRERLSDPGTGPHRFIEPETWTARSGADLAGNRNSPAGHWLVHFRRQTDSPFKPFLSSAAGASQISETIRVGEFDLFHLVSTP